jgi:hypothetical protein
MATTSPFSVLTTDGNYEINTLAGREHLVTLKGTWDGATITLTTYNPASLTYTSVDSGSWTADAEFRFIPTSNLCRLVVTNDGATTSIAVNLIPIRDK